MESLDFEKYTKIRRTLHQIPELKFDCFATKELLIENLKAVKEDIIIKDFASTGFTVDVSGTGPVSGEPKVIALRTDMDGLPIEEQTGVSYSSRSKGKMHACGHDGHMIILLATFESYCQILDKLPADFTVRFLFQPAEEGGPGAAKMIEEGVLNSVDEIYGLHNMTLFEVGEIGLVSGAIMARIDIFDIKIIGKGGHGSTPHNCNSPLDAGLTLCQQLKSIVSEVVDSKCPTVLTIGKFNSGSTSNVIPETAEISGSIRSLSDKCAIQIIERMNNIAKAIELIYKVKVEMKINKIAPATINSDSSYELVDSILRPHFKMSQANLPVMASEDFAYFLENKPGCFFMLGTRDETHIDYLHTDKYDYNDESTPYGVEAFLRIIENRASVKLI